MIRFICLFRAKGPILGLLFFLSLTFCLASCTWRSDRVAQKHVIEVGEHSLTAKEFSHELAQKLKGFDALSAKDPQIILRAKKDVLRSFVIESLTLDYAKKNKIEVADKDVEAEINSVRMGYPDDISFRKVLAEENLSLAQWKESLRRSLVAQKVFKTVTAAATPPSDEEIKKKYQEEPDRYRRKERILLRQIVTDDLTKTKVIRDEIKKNDFALLAKKYSVAPEAGAGGLVGWVEKGSVDIFDKAFALPVGGISQVLESPYGFHIFKVEKKLPAGLAPLSEVYSQIKSELLAHKQQGEYLAWLDRQIRSVKVLQDAALVEGITVETIGEK